VHSIQYISKSLVAGGIAGCCAKTVIAPLDRIKILFQASNPHYHQYSGTFGGVFRALNQVSTKEGLWAHFKGHTATLARIFPYAALQYMSYEQFKTVCAFSFPIWMMSSWVNHFFLPFQYVFPNLWRRSSAAEC